MRQRLGKIKHLKCEKITSNKYITCLTRGGWKHFEALCICGNLDSDIVNYKTGMWWPDKRNGKHRDREPASNLHLPPIILPQIIPPTAEERRMANILINKGILTFVKMKMIT